MNEFIKAEQWSARYDDRSTPWDLGRAHPELVNRLPNLKRAGNGRAFVPGCGRGHDALALARSGWMVTALDFAERLRDELVRRMENVGSTAVIGDAFEFGGGPFELVFDHTFFCAIEPDRRLEFGDLIQRVTERGSSLMSVVFPIGKPAHEPSPPWGIATDDMTEAIGDGWELVVDEEAINPPERAWEARWAEWRRIV